MREVKLIRCKRIHISVTRRNDSGKAGHWWLEIGTPQSAALESYGWWPVPKVSYWNIFMGVPGILNDGLNLQIPPRDPHHGETGDEEFCPLVDDVDSRSDSDIANCLRDFAKSYSGKWQWFFGWGRNCHTFQRAALAHCRLVVPGSIRKKKL